MNMNHWKSALSLALVPAFALTLLIKKGLDGAGIKNTVDLSVKTVTIDGDADCEARAVEILDDLGFTAVEV